MSSSTTFFVLNIRESCHEFASISTLIGCPGDKACSLILVDEVGGHGVHLLPELSHLNPVEWEAGAGQVGGVLVHPDKLGPLDTDYRVMG